MSTQLNNARTAGSALKGAKKKLDEVKRAQYTSASASNIRSAQSAVDSAQRAFDSAYRDYVASERRNDAYRRVESESYFL